MVLSSAPAVKPFNLKGVMQVVIPNSSQLELTKMDIPTECSVHLQHNASVSTQEISLGFKTYNCQRN